MKQLLFLFATVLIIENLFSQELTTGYSPGFYTASPGNSFQNFGNKLSFGFSRNSTFPIPIPFVTQEGDAIGFKELNSFQNASISYLSTQTGEKKYTAVSIPITIGLGKEIGRKKNTMLGLLGAFEAVYPIRRYTTDPVHASLSGGAYLGKTIRDKFTLNVSAQYGITVGQSSLRNFISSNFWLGYKLL